MQVFCLLYSEESDTDPLHIDIKGVYSRLETARENMRRLIFGKAEDSDAFAYFLTKDENHDDFRESLERDGVSPQELDAFFERETVSMRMPDGIRKALGRYLDENADDSYSVFVGEYHSQSYRFEIDEQTLEET